MAAPSHPSRTHQPPPSLLELMRSSPARSPVTHGLLLINVLVFVLMLGWGAGVWHTTSSVQLAWGANFGPATQDGQWWRLFTAMFIHFGVLHLGMNMWALRDVGRLVERLYGPWRFATVYLVSGVLGNLTSLAIQGSKSVSAGASGAIFGLYGALLVFLWRERRQLDRSEFKLLFGIASIFTVLMLGMGWVMAGIDNAAHAGGLIAGALLAAGLAKPWTAASPPRRWGPLLALICLMASTGWLIWNLAPPSYLLHDELKVRDAIQHFNQANQRIGRQWDDMMARAPREGLSFDQLAGQIDTTVTAGYEHSFEQLMAATPSTPVPSASTLNQLQAFALQRAQASRDLADGLRSQNPEKIRQAIRQAQAPMRVASQPRHKGMAESPRP